MYYCLPPAYCLSPPPLPLPPLPPLPRIVPVGAAEQSGHVLTVHVMNQRVLAELLQTGQRVMVGKAEEVHGGVRVKILARGLAAEWGGRSGVELSVVCELTTSACVGAPE